MRESWFALGLLVAVPGSLLGGCDDSDVADGIANGGSGASTAGSSGAGGSGGSGGSAGNNSGGAAGCGEVTPASVGCAERHEDQLERECTGAYSARRLTGTCGPYRAVACNTSFQGTLCMYDPAGAVVFWETCQDSTLSCSNHSSSCRRGGVADEPECTFDPEPQPAQDAGASDAGGSDAGQPDASALDAG